MGTLLEIRQVDQMFRTGFWLKKAHILHEINLSIPKRSIVGFLGPNGAGKTTLIHLIVGLRKPTRGEITLDGLDVTSPQARAKMGYLPERPYFYEHLTAEKLLTYLGRLSGMDPSSIEARIPVVLEQVGLSHARRLELRKFSKGMLQRIGIAQAILHNPEFLVLDEPMSGLDPAGRKEIRELIQQLGREGRTIFFSSHIIPDVEAICDQVAVIKEGRIMSFGPIGRFLSEGPLKTEIGFHGVGSRESLFLPEVLGPVELETIPDGFKVVVSSQKVVNQALEALIAQRAQILWVTPIRPSLEEIYIRPKPTV